MPSETAADNPIARAGRLALAREPGAPVIPKLLADGNEMCAAGAIFAGCTFFGGYPITPSTEIMQFLGRELWKYGGVFLQAEDEIAGAGAAVGASFAGHKAMTANFIASSPAFYGGLPGVFTGLPSACSPWR